MATVILELRHRFKVRTYKLLAENGPRAQRVFLQHERLNLERRSAGALQDDSSSVTAGGSVKTGDIAQLMEMFQVCPHFASVTSIVTLRLSEFPSQVQGL